MVFSDTTNKDGMVQAWEFWTRHKDGAATGTLLKQVTARVNAAFDRIMPLLLMYSDHIRWDDVNHTDAPIGYLDLTVNKNEYKLTEDDNSLDILNITKVRVLRATGDTQRHELDRITLDDPRVAEIMSPDTSVTGKPNFFLEALPFLYTDVLSDATITDGIEIFFGREQSYFASTDTTKEAGIPLPFHELLVLYAALDWNMVNRTRDGQLIGRLQARIDEIERDLKNFIDLRNPTRAKMTMAPRAFR